MTNTPNKELLLPELFVFTDYEIILTWDCNLSCTYCYEHKDTQASRPSGGFTPENIEQLIIFILKSHDPRSPSIHLQFFGGEPVLCLETIKVIIEKMEAAFLEKFPQQKLSYGMTTNVTAITKETAKYLAQKQFGVLVSLDGSKESHDLNRGAGTFEQVMLRLAYLRALQVSLQIRMTVSLNTIAEFVANFQFVNSLQLPFLWQLDTTHDYSPEILHKFVQDLHLLYSENNPIFDTTMQRFSARENQPGYCINPYKTISVSYDGSLFICSRATLVIGDIWSGITNYESLKQLPIYGGEIKKECLNCLSFEFCKGGCLGEHLVGIKQGEIGYIPNRKFCLTQHILQIFKNEQVLRKQNCMV